MNKAKKVLTLPAKYREYKELAAFYKKEYEKSNHLHQQYKTWFPPGHFYSPYPNLKDVRRRRLTLFDRSKKEIPGIDMNEKEQLRCLRMLSRAYKDMPYPLRGTKKRDLRYLFKNDAFSYTDGIVLFCMLHHLKPKRVIEIGSGYSSAIMLDTNERYFDNKMELTFVEPYPQLLKSLTKNGDEKHYELEDKNLSEVKEGLFEQLESGDILFVDSTHVSKIGSDVNQIFFDILPRLKKGVIVHIHDVFYPFEYPEEWIKQTRAWNEDYLLRAFLHNNHAYEIMFFNHFMNIHHTKEMDTLLPGADKNYGGSLWLKKVS